MAKTTTSEIVAAMPAWVKVIVIGGIFMQVYAIFFWSRGVHKELSKKQKLY